MHKSRSSLLLKGDIDYYLYFPSRFEILVGYSLLFFNKQNAPKQSSECWMACVHVSVLRQKVAV